MSVSMYQSQVDRVTREIADLRTKLAAEESKVADYRSRAMRASEAMDRASSSGMRQSKTREVERYARSAADHQKRAAQIGRQLASKQSSLTSARRSLDHASKQQQQRALPESLHVRPAPMVAPSAPVMREFDEHYDVCLSFAGEQRGYVELVAQGLKDAGLRVFYDQDEDIAAKLWGRDLTEYLDYVYRKGSRVCLMFVSSEYAAKEWTRLERRSALDRAMRESGEYVLPVRFDDTELPGLRPSVAYLNVREIAPATLVDFVVRKLRGDDDAA